MTGLHPRLRSAGVAVSAYKLAVGADATEAERLSVLRSYGILDTGAEDSFDALTELAADLCEVPMATVTLVDEDRQWFKSRVGVDVCETSRDDSFCAHALHRADLLIVPDTELDPRFVNNALVTGSPRLRFYAGAPLITPTGHTLGTLCVMDTVPRDLTATQQRHLAALARQVMAQLTLRRQADALATEVAARRTSEIAVEANDRLLRGVLSHPDALIYAKDLLGRYVLANDAVHDLLGMTPGDLLSRTDYDVLPAEAADLVRLNDLEVADTAERQVVTENFRHRDGTERLYLSTKFPLRDANDRVYAVAGVSTDVTTQRAALAALEKSERRWRQLFDESPVGIGLADEFGCIVSANAALCALLGRTESDVVGRNASDFTHGGDLDEVGRAREFLGASAAPVMAVEKRYLRPDGEIRWAWLTVAQTPGPDGEPWMLAHVQDITERIAADRAVRDSEANLSAVAQVVQQIQNGGDARQTIVTACASLALADYVCLLEPADNRTLRVTAASVPGLAELELPFRAQSLVWRTLNGGETQFLVDPPLPAASSPLGRALGGAPVRALYVAPVRFNDTTSGVLIAGWSDPLPRLDDKRTGLLALLADQAGVALRQHAMNEELQQLAVTDALTGLPNRRGWDAAVQNLLTTLRPGDRLVIALIDFDHFKTFNDTRGHAAGDDLLRDFARRARAGLRARDTLARWGGEEFALALPHCSGPDIDAVLNRVAAAMPGGQTCSIGYAELSAEDSIDQLLVEADTALYIAKNNGRNQIRHFQAPAG